MSRVHIDWSKPLTPPAVRPWYLSRPTCRRCGQPAEQCMFYHPDECVGVPCPPDVNAWTDDERRFLSSVARHHDRVRGG